MPELAISTQCLEIDSIWDIILNGTTQDILDLENTLESFCGQNDIYSIVYHYAFYRINFIKREYSKSVEHFNEVTKICSLTSEGDFLVFVKLRNFKDNCEQKRESDIQRLSDDILTQVESVQSFKLKSIVLNDLGVYAYKYNCAFLNWRELLQASITISVENLDFSAALSSIVNCSGFYLQTGDFKRALYYKQLGYSVLSKCEDFRTAGTYMFSPWGTFKKTKNISRQLIAFSLNNSAALLELGDVSTAISELTNARSLATSEKMKSHLSIVNSHLAYIHKMLGEVEISKKYYQEAINYFQCYGISDENFLLAQSNLAEIEIEQGNYNEAERLFLEISNNNQASNIPTYKAMLFKDWAKLYIKKGEPNRAIQLLEEGLELSQSLGQQSLTCKYFRMLGMVYSSIHTETSYDYLMKALILSDEIKYKDELLVIHKELSTYYKLMGDTAQALLHFERHVQIKDELFNEQTNTKLRNLEILHEVEQYKSKLELTTSKVQLLETQLESKTNEIQVMLLAMLQRQELLQKLERGLLQVLKTQKRKQDEAIAEFVKMLQKESNSQSSMNEIHQKFKEINQHFVNLLNNIAPNLTPLEIRLCILSRLSFSTKEIAALFNVSERTVENNRSRVRKKLNLQSTDNLVSYLMSLETKQISQDIPYATKQLS